MNVESFYRVVIGRVGTTPGTPTSISKPYPTSCLLSYSHRYTPGFCCSTKISLALRCHYFNPCSKTPKELVPLGSMDSVFPPLWSAAPSQAPCTQPGLCVFQSQSAVGCFRIPFLCLSSFHCVQTSALEALLSPWACTTVSSHLLQSACCACSHSASFHSSLFTTVCWPHWQVLSGSSLPTLRVSW